MSAHPLAIKSPRIVFIDVVRAYAILMMLQGHFIDTLLAPEYRDDTNAIYSLWFFMRGMTAPIFFFSTGLVFVYLLLKDGRPLSENVRVKKGIRRGFFLIALGYILKLNIPSLLIFKTYPSFFVVDVLHCIGIALLALVGAYAIQATTRIPLRAMLLVAGIVMFFLNPSFEKGDWSFLPKFLANYFTLKNGSIFTPVPWIGYTFFGGILGATLHYHPKWAFSWWFPSIIAALGFTFSQWSYPGMQQLALLTGADSVKAMVAYHHLFWRLGHVFIVVSMFMGFIPLFKHIPKLITQIGSETLTIYSVHYIMLYGTWFGIGLSPFLYRSLGPWAAAIGAVLFIAFFVVMIWKIEEIRNWLYNDLAGKLRYYWRVFKMVFQRRLLRFSPALANLQRRSYSFLKLFM